MPSELPDYLSESVSRFLNDTAVAQATPGGGSVTALSAALGCALARMAAGYTLNNVALKEVHPTVTGLEENLARAETMFRGLIREDMQVYQNYCAARKESRESQEGASRFRRAGLTALSVPVEMIAIASTALKACDDLKDAASPYLLSDLLAAAHLLQGAAQAAAANARVNLKGVEDIELAATYKSQITSSLSHAELHLASVRAFVGKALALPS